MLHVQYGSHWSNKGIAHTGAEGCVCKRLSRYCCGISHPATWWDTARRGTCAGSKLKVQVHAISRLAWARWAWCTTLKCTLAEPGLSAVASAPGAAGTNGSHVSMSRCCFDFRCTSCTAERFKLWNAQSATEVLHLISHVPQRGHFQECGGFEPGLAVAPRPSANFTGEVYAE